MAEDEDGVRSRINDGGDILRFFSQAVVRTGFTFAVTATIHCTNCEVRSKQRKKRFPTAAVTRASMNNQETWAFARAFNGGACSIF